MQEEEDIEDHYEDVSDREIDIVAKLPSRSNVIVSNADDDIDFDYS